MASRILALNLMEYDEAEGAYNQNLFLKLDVYNYRDLFLPALSDQFEVEEIEDSFYETENENLVLFYHRLSGTSYDDYC